MAERPTSRDTKNEILKMYDELLQENERLEVRVQQLLKEKQTAAKGKTVVVEKAPVGKLPAAPSTIDAIIETLSVLQPGFGDAASELSAQLIAEASKLQELRRNLEQESQQLDALHGLQVADGTLEELIREYTEKSDAFEAEAKEQQEEFAQEIAEKKKAWQQQQAEHTHLVKERDETKKKTEQREAAEYTYDLELQRKLDNEQYEQEQERLKKTLESFEQTKKREWAEREQRIAEQEIEFKTLHTQVEKFPKELEAAIKEARAEGTKLAQRQTKIKADLRAKEAEGERRVYELKAQSMEDTIKNQLQQIKALSTQLDAAVKQAQTLAMKAIEGTSSTGSLQAVKEIALEQAKNVQKGK